MPYLEADLAVVYGRLVEGLRIPFPRDEYYKTIIIPGFSDTHAHPQVIDAGMDFESDIASWSDSYDWLENRNMVIDEARVRGDIGLSASLAEIALKRAVLEGVTLIAFTGRLEANLKARLRFPYGPRMVLLPTIMDKEGWARPSDVERLYEQYSRYINDSLLRPGVFVHSLRYAGRETVLQSLRLAYYGGMPFGLHLSEGVPEIRLLSQLLSEAEMRPRIIAVHCISDDPRGLGLRCSSCPGTNMILYGRTRPRLAGTTSFGSDWPHLIGTVPRHLPLIKNIYGNNIEAIMYRATIGGYRDYGITAAGDLVAYDGDLDDIMEGRVLPKLVTVAGSIVVYESRIAATGENINDILGMLEEVVSYASETYGYGGRPRIPGPEVVWKLARNLQARSTYNSGGQNLTRAPRAAGQGGVAWRGS